MNGNQDEDILGMGNTGAGGTGAATPQPPAAPPQPQGLVAQAGPSIDSKTPTAYLGEVDPSKTVQGLVSQITSKDSDLMQRASQQGMSVASRRGLGNSSVAAQASMGAMLDAALPIANADANIYQNQQAQNQQAMNVAAGVSNEAILTRLKTESQNYAVDNEFRNRILQQYQEGVNSVLNNKDMTPEQKQASIDKMFANAQGVLQLQAATSTVNIGQYKPGGTGGLPGGQAGGAPLPGGNAGNGAVTDTSAIPVNGTLSQQMDFLQAKGVSTTAITHATGKGYPLVLGNGAFLVASKDKTMLNGRQTAPAVTLYYNPADGQYVDRAGRKVAMTDWTMSRLFGKGATRPWV